MCPPHGEPGHLQRGRRHGQWLRASPLRLRQLDACSLPRVRRPGGKDVGRLREMDNYRMIMVDRSFGWNGTIKRRAPRPAWRMRFASTYVVDAVTGLPAPATSRPDCRSRRSMLSADIATLHKRRRTYANWFTYYRSRLFAAIGVMAEVASDLTGPEQFMRMGYGRINYFPDMRNNWNVASFTDRNPRSTLPEWRGFIPNVEQSNAGCVRSRFTSPAVGDTKSRAEKRFRLAVRH